MTSLVYPNPGETLRDLVRRVLPDLPPEVRAGVQVVTGGTRAGLVVPQHAPPVAKPAPAPEPPAGGVPAVGPLPAESTPPDPNAAPKRRPRRRTPPKETS